MSRFKILWEKVRDQSQRVLYFLALVSFSLPFVSVKGCASKQIHDYRGYELLREHGGWLYLIPIGLGVLFLALSFLSQRGDVVIRGFVSSMRTVLAFAAGYAVAVGPYLQFLFDEVHWRVGQYIVAASWAIVFVTSLSSALISMKRTWPPRRAAGVELKGGPIRIVFWLLVALTLGLFGISVALCIISQHGERYWALIVVIFALCVYLALPFAEAGLKGQERWAAAWVVASTFLLLATGILTWLVPRNAEPSSWIVAFFFLIPVTATAIGVGGLAISYFFTSWKTKLGDSEHVPSIAGLR